MEAIQTNQMILSDKSLFSFLALITISGLKRRIKRGRRKSGLKMLKNKGYQDTDSPRL